MPKKELKKSKRKLVNFLKSGGNERSIYEIKDYLKTGENAISTQRINVILEDLNHDGILSTRESENGIRMIKLDDSKLESKWERDRFIPDLAFLVIISTVGGIISFLFFSPHFLFGSLFSVVLFSTFIVFKIFRTPDMKRFFYEVDPNNNN